MEVLLDVAEDNVDGQIGCIDGVAHPSFQIASNMGDKGFPF